MSITKITKKKKKRRRQIIDQSVDGVDSNIDSELQDEMIHTLAQSHDKICRSVLKDDDIAGNFFENYLDPKYAKMIDFSKLQYYPTNDIDKNLNERIGDLR
ncbi:MAG: Rpn family recombination-promoting nuclease/putative transposase, partial [Planctomycetaceae bacterium]|nr:Rpn family recombination-promoting nuclease/putative transposase [Planctomycetaceae bacterium]